jgi:hypothetical protein
VPRNVPFFSRKLVWTRLRAPAPLRSFDPKILLRPGNIVGRGQLTVAGSLTTGTVETKGVLEIPADS